MNKLSSRIIRMAAATALLVPAAAALTTSPANALTWERCTRDQHRSFSTPGFNTDLTIDVCVFYDSAFHTRYADFFGEWSDGGDSAADGNRKFDALRLTVRLERYDKAYKTASCSIAGQVNRHEHGAFSCGTSNLTTSLANGWTSDGTVTYDIDRDGKGASTWSLTGSPQQM